ncbi:transporter [Olsenella sp. An285]|uniref:transporter n=1 Tax=Olsenella sp. An285 TaxID=1965621 RepID=UPI000B3A2DCB|nr:transporter [Olsenella sp. An285]OUO46807.1 transporter [Olsenella sp. An285]
MGKSSSGRGSRARALLALHAMLALYSLSSVCAKLAAGFDFMSVGFVGCYAGMIALLGIYAIGWQQVIKRLPLTFAYANKAVTVAWGIVWGMLLFNERVSPLKLLGALIVLAGVVLFSLAEKDEGEDATIGRDADE